MNSIRVSEHFYSLQGEGKTAGIPAIFIRLQACNLMCGGIGTEKDGKLHNGATWRCDTLDVWIKGTKYSVQEFTDILLEEYSIPLKQECHIVFTGGEPLMQQKAIIDIINLLKHAGYHNYIEIETNGTIIPKPDLDSLVDLYNVSPKLANSGVEKNKRFKSKVLNFFINKNSIFKFVISNEENWKEISLMMLPTKMIYLMPNAEDKEELYSNHELVSETCKREGVNFTTRLQIVLWDKTTGV